MIKSRQKRIVLFPNIITMRVDDETQKELEIVALYDKKQISTWIRDMINDTIQRYQRNPQYLRFKNKLAERDQKIRS